MLVEYSKKKKGIIIDEYLQLCINYLKILIIHF